MTVAVQEKEGYRIVRRGDVKRSSSPIDCPLCLCVVIDELDTTAIMRTGCCFDCETEVADPNREKWLTGWRPSKKQLEKIRSRRLTSAHSRKHI